MNNTSIALYKGNLWFHSNKYSIYLATPVYVDSEEIEQKRCLEKPKQRRTLSYS